MQIHARWNCVFIPRVQISVGVTASDSKEQGAGDQGLMFGYATNETEAYAPPYNYGTQTYKETCEVRKS